MHQHVVQGGELREIGITRVRPPAAPSGSSATRKLSSNGVLGSVLFRPVSRLPFRELFDWRPEGLHALR